MKATTLRIGLYTFLLLAVAGSGSAKAQEAWWGAVVYQGAQAAGTTADFTDGFSWRNVGLELRGLVNDHASVGLFAGWNVFHADTEGLVSIGSVDASGRQWRFVNAFPILATGHYYLGQSGRPRLFAGVGVGTYYIENRLQIGLTALESNNWHFGFAPEVGLAFPWGQSGLHGALSVKYNYAAQAGGIEHGYWTFGIGLGQLMRTR